MCPCMISRSAYALLLASTAPGVLASCDQSEKFPPLSTSSQAANGEVQMVANPYPTEVEEWLAVEPPAIHLGDAAGFHGIRGAWMVSSEHVAVADAGVPGIRLIGHNSERQIGKRGRGPGEYLNLESAFFSGGLLYTYDSDQRRIIVWNVDGSLVADHALPELPAGSGDWSLAGIFANGKALLLRTSSREGGTGRVRMSADYYIYDMSTGANTHVGTYPLSEAYVVEHDMRRTTLSALFARNTAVVVSGPTYQLMDNDRYLYRVYSQHGQELRAVGQERPRVPITDREAQEARSVKPIPQIQQVMTRAFAEMPIPATHVVAGYSKGGPTPRPFMIVADGGDTWILDRPADGGLHTTWSVFDRAGKAVRTVEFPHEVSILHAAGDWALAHWRDTLGVEHLAKYRLAFIRRHIYGED